MSSDSAPPELVEYHVVRRERHGDVIVLWYGGPPRPRAVWVEPAGHVFAPDEGRDRAEVQEAVRQGISQVTGRRARLLEAMRETGRQAVEVRGGVWVLPGDGQDEAASILAWLRELADWLCARHGLPRLESLAQLHVSPELATTFCDLGGGGLCLSSARVSLLALTGLHPMDTQRRLLFLPICNLYPLLCHELSHLRFPLHDSGQARLEGRLELDARRYVLRRRSRMPAPVRPVPASRLVRRGPEGRFRVRQAPGWERSLARLMACDRVCAAAAARLGLEPPTRWTELPVERAFHPYPFSWDLDADGAGVTHLRASARHAGVRVRGNAPWCAAFLLRLALRVLLDPEEIWPGTPEFRERLASVKAALADDLLALDRQFEAEGALGSELHWTRRRGVPVSAWA